MHPPDEVVELNLFADLIVVQNLQSQMYFCVWKSKNNK